MNLTSSVPVRFTVKVKKRLDSVSENTGIPVAQLIRIATEEYLNRIIESRQIVVPMSLREEVNKDKGKSSAL